MMPIVRPSIGPGSVVACESAGEDVTSSRGDLFAQIGVDVGEYLQFSFLDGLFLALAEREGERLDDVHLLDIGHAAVEDRRLREVVLEGRRLLPHRATVHRTRRLHVAAVSVTGGQWLVAVNAVGPVWCQPGVESRSGAYRRAACR